MSSFLGWVAMAGSLYVGTCLVSFLLLARPGPRRNFGLTGRDASRPDAPSERT